MTDQSPDNPAPLPIPETPFKVNTSSTNEEIGIPLRYMATVLAGIVVQHGWAQADQKQIVMGVILAASMTLWGWVKTRINEYQKRVMASHVDDRIAQLVQK